MSPRALPPGAALDVSFAGSDLEGGTLWISCAPKESPAALSSNALRSHIVLPASATPGIYAARLFASNGVSNLLPFLIDDLPTIAAGNTNGGRESAAAVTPPCAVEGSTRELGLNWFRFRAVQGHRVSLEIVAARLGSRLDSVLRVLDADGREVGYSDDGPGLPADSFVSFVAPATGEYFVEVRDVNYAGGEDFFYRLRIGDFPMVGTTFPVSARRAETNSFALLGPEGPAGRCSAVVGAAEPAVHLAGSGRAGAGFITSPADDLPQAIEVEPNDSPPNAVGIAVPCAINGRFDKPNDRDCYSFGAAAGQKLVFKAHTRSVGSPCDVLMQVKSAGGETLARSNPGAPDEGTLACTFAAAGTCHLLVSEATGAGGPALTYYITAEPNAGFALAADADAVQPEPGGFFDLRISCARTDYRGAVTLAVAGVGDLSVSNNVIPAEKTNITMTVRVPDSFAPAVPRHLSVIGRAKTGAAPTVRARTSAALRKTWPLLLYPPFEFDGIIALGVKRK